MSPHDSAPFFLRIGMKVGSAADTGLTPRRALRRRQWPVLNLRVAYFGQYRRVGTVRICPRGLS